MQGWNNLQSSKILKADGPLLGPLVVSLVVSLFYLIIFSLPKAAMSEEIKKAQDSNNLVSTAIIMGGPLQKVGQGKYTKFGFTIYNASLWAPQGKWSYDKPFALELAYTRNLGKETVVDSVYDSIKEQKIADDGTLARWKEILMKTIPAVKKGDKVVVVSKPGTKATVILNGENQGAFPEQALSDAFFAIWLGEKADQHLKQKLLGI